MARTVLYSMTTGSHSQRRNLVMGANWNFKNLNDGEVDRLVETYAAWVQACATNGMGSVEEATARRAMDSEYVKIKSDVSRRKLMGGLERNTNGLSRWGAR